jgi:PAS domain S-box-containing protein
MVKVQKGVKPRLYNSLAFKIGALIVVVELIIFTTIGIYYTNYFHSELIKRVEAQIKTPGILMNQGVLRYDAIENRNVIGEIVGGELREGMIIGLNRRVFFSFDQEKTGEMLENIIPLELREQVFDFTIKGPKVVPEENTTGEFLHCFSPLYSVNGAIPRFFVYIKVDTSWIDIQRKELSVLFSIGSFLCILLTSILIFLFFHRFIFTRLTQLGIASSTITTDQLELKIPQNIVDSKDEISVLAGSFTSMTEDLKKTTTSIDNLNREIIQRKEAEAKNRSLLENSPDYILNLDRSFTIHYLNRPFEQHSVYDTIGKNVFEFINKDNQERIRKAIVEVFEDGECEMINMRNTMPNGQDYWLEIRFASIESGGHVNEVMVIISDITERIRAQEELEAAQKELVEKAHRAGMFDIASSNLHFVGNILNSVVTSSHIIKKITRNPSSEKLKKANEVLCRSLSKEETPTDESPNSELLFQYYVQLEKTISGEIKEINDQINIVSEKVDSIDHVVKSQQQYVSFGSITDEHDLVEIIEDVIKIHSKELEQNSVKVDVNANNTYIIQAQRVKMVHILKSLIKNAIVSMQKTPVDSRVLRFLVQREPDNVILKISDQGIGIEKENIDKIFFFGTNSKENGFGYGLHSSANYMSEMGGHIWAESEGKDKGATFFLKFKSIA